MPLLLASALLYPFEVDLVGQLAAFARDPVRSFVSALLGFTSLVFLLPGWLGVAREVGKPQPRLARWSVGTFLVGSAVCLVFSGLDLALAEMADPAADRAEMVAWPSGSTTALRSGS